LNLDKLKTIFPDFQMENWNFFDTVISLKWETVFDDISWEEHKNLIVEMASLNHDCKILLEFIDVHSLRFQGNGQVSGFYIKDMSARGYEHDSKYEIGNYEYEEDGLEFYCSDIVIRDLQKI